MVVPVGKEVFGSKVQLKSAMPQLSVAVGSSQVIKASQDPGSLSTMMFAGPLMISGSSSSTTVTTNICSFTFPLTSVTVHVTIVSPTENQSPELWLTTSDAMPQLSVKVGASQLNVAAHSPSNAEIETLPGKPSITGSSVSTSCSQISGILFSLQSTAPLVISQTSGISLPSQSLSVPSTMSQESS